MTVVVPLVDVTLRAMLGRRRTVLLVLLAGLPVLVALLIRVSGGRPDADRVLDTLVVRFVMALVALIVGTAVLGSEIEDGTAVYLMVKPIARWRIVLPKLAAAFLVGGIPVAVSGFLAVAVVGGGGALRGALATGAGLLVGAAAYGALFTWAGLATRHALLIGLVYVFVWEATLAAYLDGIRFLSIRRYTLAVIHGLDAARLATIENPLSAGAALVAAAVVVVGFTALAVRKLVRLDVP